MTNDPLNRYQSMMREAKAPDHLPDKVLQQARTQANASATGHEHSSADAKPRVSSRAASATPRSFSVKRSRFKGYAVAACLAVLALTVGLSLALPGLGKKTAPFDFSVQAYGASTDTILSMGANGTIIFDVDDLQMMSAGQYQQQVGTYVGCQLRIEGSDIVRIQANIDRGELYRYTRDEFVKSSDPERWTSILNWKQTKIGEEGPLASYDLVHADLGDDGKDRNDPDKLVAAKYYQRLGSTIDVAVNDQEGSRLSDYCFGLWTNQTGATLDSMVDAFDGAKLTITVEKTDGTNSTKIIELTAADVRANIVPAENGGSSTLQLVPEIVDLSAKSDEDIQNDYANGITTIHTLYGTIAEQNGESFPCGEASYPTLEKPLTEPLVIEPIADVPTYEPGTVPGPDLETSAISDLGTTYTMEYSGVNANREPASASLESAITKVERLDALPQGMRAADIPNLYPEGKTSDEWLARNGYSIDADGTLTPGYSYVLVSKTVTNTSDQQVDAQVASGYFVALGEEDNGTVATTYQSLTEVMWRSNNSKPIWDSRMYFETLDPGETFTFKMLFVVSDEALSSSNLAFVSETGNMGFKQAYRVGAVS
ncbi:MAG: hypothetical protein RSG23_10415 [Gordonibacter sp.]